VEKWKFDLVQGDFEFDEPGRIFEQKDRFCSGTATGETIPFPIKAAGLFSADFQNTGTAI
jgi:hypothetical protein